MKCLSCGHENREGAKFCIKCSKPLRAEIVCSQCGHTNPQGALFCEQCARSLAKPAPVEKQPQPHPTSFASGRYQVKKFLGEGGKKKVYLAHDTVLDRDVAFALIKTEKLDETALARIKREAQAMGRLGGHPHIMSIFDLGDHQGQPYIVLPIMAGGDVEGLIKKAPEHKLPLEQAISIARAVCQGLAFAHSKGIIHRDIKPGNVMLSGQGVVQICDFGLAVSQDLSRLTQHGMMVGTVSYMPPEQAMGGEVTTKADLYSLGAMLYEMVTGRPPFVGDDSVAIIGQHINTPPVSPTWHRADLPPVLETLILQLLEKDPTKRPSSATDVLKVLESLEAGKFKSITKTETPAPATASPLYRRVFIGREAELKQLQAAFDGAISGQGALMMVVGEPGIGKTATCEQLATYVALRGGKTLVGHCYEKGSLSLPYLGFVEALRGYVISQDSQELKKELGTGAADVARIVSEIREKLKVKPKAGGDPEEERYRLLQAVTGFLTHAASVQPLMVLLEDLHDADKGTLDMLVHVSRNLAGTRLLLVGTYRDVEVDRTHPLSAALAELRRVSSYGRVLLRGLNADEVRRMLEAIAGQEVPWGLAEAVHRQTEGNPLFVQEVVRYLNEEGLIKREGGQWKGKSETQLAMSIPEGLRDVIGKRLSLMSKECNQLLSVASVIGREFRLEVLQKVAGLSDELLFKTLEEAKKTAVIEERAGVGAAVSYRFTHAFFRQTLYEETIAPKRIRLHQQVARALEEIYASRLEDHATELAEHFSYSSDSADLKKAISYSEMAARRATDVYAYGEAVRLLEQALKVQEILDLEDKVKRCDLLLALCAALNLAPDLTRVLNIEAPAALALAESLSDSSRTAKACVAGLFAIVGLTVSWTDPQFVEWAGRLDRYAMPETVERSYADWALGLMKCATGDMRSGHRLLTLSLNMARRLGDQTALCAAAFGILTYFATPHHTAERTQVAEQLWANRGYGLNSSFTLAMLYIMSDTFLTIGQRQRVEEVYSQMRAIATHTRNVISGLWSEGMDAVLALLDGRLEVVISMANNLRIVGREIGIAAISNVLSSFADVRARIYLGASLEDLEQELGELAAQRPEEGEMRVCLVKAHRKLKEEAAEILERNVVKRPGISTPEDETLTWADILNLETSVLINHRRSAELLLDRFNGSGLYTSGVPYTTCIARHLGGAAALLGRYDEARKYYQEAIKVCTEMPFRPELALSRMQLAELLLERYPEERKEALEHLDFAIKEFREMKMQPSLERALRQKKILKA